MRFSRIWLYDNVIIGNNHTTINSALLDVACSLADSGTVPGGITMYGEVSHLDILKKEAHKRSHETKIDFIPIQVVPPKHSIVSKILSWLKKIQTDRKEFQQMLQKADQERPDLIIFNTLVATNLQYFFRLISRRPDLEFLLIIHGEIEYLFGRTRGRKRIIGMQYEQAFKNIPGNLKLAVLNEYSRDKLLESGLLKGNDILYIKHPISYKPYYEKGITSLDRINFTHIGVANDRKNSHLIFELAKVFSKKSNLHFSIIGRVDGAIRNLQNELVHVISEDGNPIPQEEFDAEILKSHYSLCFFQGEEYIYRVSGSLLDSVAYGLPIIALKHPAAEELFGQGGNIGFLCNDLEEMKKVINKIADGDNDYVSMYTVQRENLVQLAKLYLPENVAVSLKEDLESLILDKKIPEKI